MVDLTDAVEVSVGGNHSCATRSSGEVVCRGRNDFGELGDGTTTSRSTPVAAMGVSDVVEAAAGGLDMGGARTCSRDTMGEVYCWGENGGGELGDGTTTHRPTPVRILVSASAVSVGWVPGCAVLDAAMGVVCWGANFNGQLGTGSTSSSTTPVRVFGL